MIEQEAGIVSMAARTCSAIAVSMTAIRIVLETSQSLKHQLIPARNNKPRIKISPSLFCTTRNYKHNIPYVLRETSRTASHARQDRDQQQASQQSFDQFGLFFGNWILS